MKVGDAITQLVDAIERRALAHTHPETLDEPLHDREVAEARDAVEGSIVALVDERLNERIQRDNHH